MRPKLVAALALLGLLVAVGLARTGTSRAQSVFASGGTKIYFPLISNVAPSSVCLVKSLQPVQPGQSLPGVWLPDLPQIWYQPVNGVDQVYEASPSGPTVCLTCTPSSAAAPASGVNKVTPVWNPNGGWIALGVELPAIPPLPGQSWQQTEELLNGWYENVYAMTPNGSTWANLTNYAEPPPGQLVGAFGPKFTPSGGQLYYSALVRMPDGSHPFGYSALHAATFVASSSSASLQNDQNVSPVGGDWFEVDGFSADGNTLLFSSDIGGINEDGQDLFAMNRQTGQVTNLTRSPQNWDEHAAFSPSGQKISWMSSYPYTNDGTQPPDSSTVMTELMLTSASGAGTPQQLTHFNTPGDPEYNPVRSVVGSSHWSADGSMIEFSQLLTGSSFGQVNHWLLTFVSSCG